MVTHRCATVPTENGVHASHSVLTRTLLLSFPFERWGNWGKEPNECGQHWIAGKVQSRFQRISLCQWLKHLRAWFHSLSLITMSWSLPTGCMFEKGPRQFYDDTCVVPEKFDGGSLSVSLFDFYECRMHFPLLKAVNICTSRCLWTSFITHYKPVRLLGVPFAPPLWISEVTGCSLCFPLPLFLSFLPFHEIPFLEMGQKNVIVTPLCAERGIFPLPCWAHAACYLRFTESRSCN